MRKPIGSGTLGLVLAALLAGGPAGCENGKLKFKNPWAAPDDANAPVRKEVPEPIHLLLPQAIRIHPFTGTRTFDEAGGVKGIDVRVEALDAYGDSTKAYGDFHFALYRHRTGAADPKGARIATWEECLLKPKKNLLHWDSITRTYEFKLQWFKPIAVGRKFVLLVNFSSPFTNRKFAERVFISGQ